MNRLRTFLRTHGEALFFGTVFAFALVLAIGTQQQHDEAAARRMAAEAHR